MKNLFYVFQYPIYWIMLLLLSPGCVFLNTFQSPETIGHKQVLLGAGASGLRASDEDGGFGVPEVQLKYGLSDRFEIGGRLTPGALGADAKWQFIKRQRFNMAAAFNLGVSTWQFSESVDSQNTIFFSYSAAIIAGSNKFYGGLRTMQIGSNDDENDTNVVSLGNGIFFGGQLGKKKLKFIPELGLYTNRDEEGDQTPFISYGIALQYRFRK